MSTSVSAIVKNHRIQLVGDDNEFIHQLINVDLNNETEDEDNLIFEFESNDSRKYNYQCFDIPMSQTRRLHLLH